MLEFIHNIGSKVFNFFSTKFGNEGVKRQRDGLTDEFSSPNKRYRLDMEPESDVGGRRIVGDYASFSDRYYYRTERPSDSRLATLPVTGRTRYDPSCVAANAPGGSRSSVSTPAAVNSLDLGSLHIRQQMMSDALPVDTGMSGFNFSQAPRQIQDASAFKFTAEPESVKFQGYQRTLHDSVTVRVPPSDRSIAYNQSKITERCDTPRLNGADESKNRSVFSRIIGGRDASRGIKCIDPRKRNKLAVRQCVRLNEKSMYQDMLNRHLTPPDQTNNSQVECQNRPFAQKSSETGSIVWGSSSLFNRSKLLSSTRFGETPKTDSIKSRVDASRSLLTSVVSADRNMSSAPLTVWRQTIAGQRKQGLADIPERTLQTLQKSRHQPMRAPPRNEYETPAVVPNNKTTDNSSFSRKSSDRSDQHRSISTSPITIESTDYEDRRRSSRDTEVEVVAVSPGANDTSQKGSPFERRSMMSEAFERALKESRYAKKDFLLQVNSKTKSEFAKQGILERETVVKYLKDKREKSDEQLINKMHNLMRISERLPVPLEETFIEDEPEEEDICELVEEEEEEEEPSSEFLELTEEQETLVSRALVPRPADQILVEGFRLQIARKDLATLSGLNWLNDEVINFYLNLVMERSEKQGARKVYAFSTFFYPKVKSDGHKGVRRWTKSVDLFSYDYVLVPVHLGMHWCLAVVDFRKKQIRYYDSMGGNNEECLRALRSYLSDESQAKRQTTFDWNGWQFFAVKDIPQQMNGSDCGMFACKFAEYISRDAAITFDQRHMPYFRRRMVYEILTKTLM